jgi:hypothetical protein
MAIKAAVAATLLATSLLLPVAGGTTERRPGMDAPVVATATSRYSREPRSGPIVQDEAAIKGAGGQDARIAEYIEMHGRATDSSGRASLMPWSALKQIAN